MKKVKRCEYWDCGWCYHDNGPKNGCDGIEKCPIKREQYRIDLSCEINDMINGNKTEGWSWVVYDWEWDMLAEYFTHD